MKTRVLGKKAAGFGPRPTVAWACRVLRAQDDAESIATIHRALDLGLNFLEISDLYARVQTSSVDRPSKPLGGGSRTKFGNVRDETGVIGVNGHPKYVESRLRCHLVSASALVSTRILTASGSIRTSPSRTPLGHCAARPCRKSAGLGMSEAWGAPRDCLLVAGR